MTALWTIKLKWLVMSSLLITIFKIGAHDYPIVRKLRDFLPPFSHGLNSHSSPSSVTDLASWNTAPHNQITVHFPSFLLFLILSLFPHLTIISLYKLHWSCEFGDFLYENLYFCSLSHFPNSLSNSCLTSKNQFNYHKVALMYLYEKRNSFCFSELLKHFIIYYLPICNGIMCLSVCFPTRLWYLSLTQKCLWYTEGFDIFWLNLIVIDLRSGLSLLLPL